MPARALTGWSAASPRAPAGRRQPTIHGARARLEIPKPMGAWSNQCEHGAAARRRLRSIMRRYWRCLAARSIQYFIGVMLSIEPSLP